MEAALENKPLKMKKSRSKANNISKHDMEIITGLESVKKDLSFAHKNFDTTNDAVLIDSFAFEILALNKKYEYYLKLCKEKGLVSGGI